MATVTVPASASATALAQRGAQAIFAAFHVYQLEFKRITRTAKQHFETRDWHAGQAAALERLELYPRVIQRVAAKLRARLGRLAQDKATWTEMKILFRQRMAARPDSSLAETFFNSVTRRVFATVGVDSAIEFVGDDFTRSALLARQAVVPLYPCDHGLPEAIEAILRACDFQVPYPNLENDAKRAAAEIEAELARPIEAIEIINPIFYRGKGAYRLGRLWHGETFTPLVLALRHPATGLRLDAVLLTEDDISILFSFTRSYFHVEVDQPEELIAYLKALMPLKRVSELYIAIGYHKHGKTELYRELMRHLSQTDDQFGLARGERGMVMTVFTLPSFDIVFKIIRDQFAYPKSTTRQEVLAKYQLVFKHDRAGRLVDAQDFEHLEFDRARFTPELLAELQAAAANSVTLTEDKVRIRHLYTERRLTPLNLYLREAEPEAARQAVLDYGQAIRDLAATNTFPGDLLLKNFGLTRHGRVIFYDYDEVCRVTDCNFRELPRASDWEEEMSAEPWYYVNENDIFPEEFIKFMGFPASVRDVFLQAHGELFTARYWRELQARLNAGDIVDIYPYKPSLRLPP